MRVITRMKIIQEGLFPVKKKNQIHLTMQDMTADRITAEVEVIHLKNHKQDHSHSKNHGQNYSNMDRGKNEGQSYNKDHGNHGNHGNHGERTSENHGQSMRRESKPHSASDTGHPMANAHRRQSKSSESGLKRTAEGRTERTGKFRISRKNTQYF